MAVYSRARYIYFWADGIYLNVRMSPNRPCLLVIIGATEEGRKELVALNDGMRESALSWRSLLADLKQRGLTVDPELSVGDGALGFWNALEEEFPQCRHQRCWVHKTANVLDKEYPGGCEESDSRHLTGSDAGDLGKGL